MNIKLITFFALIAIGVGVVISYFPPKEHGEAIWLIVTAFLSHLGSYLIRDKPKDSEAPPPPAPPTAPPGPGPTP